MLYADNTLNKMAYSVVFKLIMVIIVTKYSISSADARTQSNDISNDHLAQTDISTYGSGRFKLNSQDNLYYDPVLWNHSALVDYLDRRNEGQYLDGRYAREKRSISLKCTGLCDRSLCPWSMHWNEDETRVPQFIRYAKCQTSYCNFRFADLGFLATFRLGMETVCEEVETDIFATKEGRAFWIRKWPIACICAKALTHEQLSDTIFSDTNSSQQEMTSQFANDAILQNYDAPNVENYDVEAAHDYPGVEDRSLTSSQKERLLLQEEKKKQNSETFEEVMRKEKKREETIN